MYTPPSSPVTTLGRYAILGRLASGGMATVYLARLVDAPEGFSREFALKVIHPHLVEEDGFTARFLQEAKLASRVRHPNVVRTVDAGEDQGYAYMALELIDGVNLRQLALHRSRPFSAPQAATLVEMVARGLDAVHSATDAEGQPLGMVHRDISPHNVMLDRRGRAVLIDLGLARPDHTTGLTQVGVLAGKLPYMSPEQARLESLDARSDLFSMGTLLFELTTGTLPFGDTHSAQTLHRLEACDAASIQAQLEEHAAPAWIAEIVLACLRRDPSDRFASASALADALGQAMSAAGHDMSTQRRALATIVAGADETLGILEPAEPLPRIAPLTETASALPQRNVLLWASAGFAAVAALGLAVWALRPAPSASTRAAPPSGAASMSEDQAAPPLDTAPVESRKRPAFTPASTPAEPAPASEPEEPPAPRANPRPRKTPRVPDPDGLRPNPYTDP